MNNEIGYINYSEFVAACLARKEGLKHEYAESIKVLPLTEMIYKCGPALCYHGVHPNR